MKKIINLLKKADKSQIEADLICGQIVNELLIFYKMGNFHNEDLNEEKAYIETISVFKQAGDGLVIADEYGNNISIEGMLKQIKTKKYFDYQDLMNNKI